MVGLVLIDYGVGASTTTSGRAYIFSPQNDEFWVCWEGLKNVSFAHKCDVMEKAV